MELNWSERDAATYQLEQQTGEGDFQLRYEGAEQASVRTGLPAGEHVFRVRALDADGDASSWSQLKLKVTYMGAQRVRLLLITGGIVVLATIAAIVHGHLTHRKEEAT